MVHPPLSLLDPAVISSAGVSVLSCLGRTVIRMVIRLDIPDETALEQRRKPIPVDIQCTDIQYHIGPSTKRLDILKGISVTFRNGELTAVMGPSGAGKTTLLHLLTGNVSGRIEGRVEINGRSLREVAGRFKGLQTLVPQDDTLYASLTPRESLRYAAKLRLPFSWSSAVKLKTVEDVLTSLSLTGCADTRVGNVERRGISGGQRKRVSIALELLTNPSVMMFDEPTSGLDAKMAEDVMEILKKLALEGRNLIATIHQPSYNIFMKFDRLVLLSDGRMVHEGPTSRVEAYFSSLGFTAPRGHNPADYLMRVLQLEPNETDSHGACACDLAAAWTQKRAQYEQPSQEEDMWSAPSVDLKSIPVANRTPWWYQTIILLHRCFVDNVKDREKLLAGLTLKLIVGVLVGVVWLKQAGTTQDSIFPVTGALFVATVSSILDTMFVTVTTCPSTKALVLREYRNGYYSIGPYYLATLACTILLNVLYSVFLATPIYLLVGIPFTLPKYLTFLAIMAILCSIGATLGLLVGSLVKDVQSAQQAMMPTVIPLLLFSGYLIPYDRIPLYFKWLYHLSPFAYAFRALIITLFKDVVFTDCFPAPSQCYTSGCYGIPPRNLCFKTGAEYLKSVNADPGILGFAFIILAAIFAALFVLGYVSMRLLVHRKTN